MVRVPNATEIANRSAVELNACQRVIGVVHPTFADPVLVGTRRQPSEIIVTSLVERCQIRDDFFKLTASRVGACDFPALPANEKRQPFSFPLTAGLLRCRIWFIHQSGLAHLNTSVNLPVGQTRGMVGQAIVVGVLMIIQGVLNLIACAADRVYAWFIPIMMEEMQQGAIRLGTDPSPLPDSLNTMIAGGGGILAGVLFVSGVLLVYAGYNVTQYRGWILALAALGLSLVTIFTCYCVLTSFAFAVYGLIFLLSR